MNDPADAQTFYCRTYQRHYRTMETETVTGVRWSTCPLHPHRELHPDPRSFPPSWQARLSPRPARRRRSWRVRP